MNTFFSSSARLRAIAGAAAAAAVLAGCANPRGIESTAKPVTPAIVGLERSAADVAPVDAAWWQAFGDSTLSSLVDQALRGNPNLAVSQARLVRAQAGADIVRAADGPQLNGTLDATRQHYSANGLVPPPLAGHTYSSATLQAGASWELDFFGRNRAALDAALGTERAARAEVQAARVLLASNVARGYVQLARLVEQREVAARSLAQREETLSLIRQRVDAGLDTRVELRQGEGALPETRQLVEAIDEQIALARHALAALTGQAPDALDTLAPRLATLQPVPLPQRLPADLLGRRADIDAARFRVEAATGDVASARAQFHPNINLTAFVGLSSIGLDRLLKTSSEQYGAGPAIRLPIFDGGRLRANLQGRTADLDAAIESYNAAVFDATRDAADQLATLQSIGRQQTEQSAAQQAAESAYDLARQRYRAGLGTFLVVLSAETNVLAQRRSATDLRARALDAQIALVRALGGGYVPHHTDTGTRHAAAATPSAR